MTMKKNHLRRDHVVETEILKCTPHLLENTAQGWTITEDSLGIILAEGEAEGVMVDATSETMEHPSEGETTIKFRNIGRTHT